MNSNDKPIPESYRRAVARAKEVELNRLSNVKFIIWAGVVVPSAAVLIDGYEFSIPTDIEIAEGVYGAYEFLAPHAKTKDMNGLQAHVVKDVIRVRGSRKGVKHYKNLLMVGDKYFLPYQYAFSVLGKSAVEYINKRVTSGLTLNIIERRLYTQTRALYLGMYAGDYFNSLTPEMLYANGVSQKLLSMPGFFFCDLQCLVGMSQEDITAYLDAHHALLTATHTKLPNYCFGSDNPSGGGVFDLSVIRKMSFRLLSRLTTPDTLTNMYKTVYDYFICSIGRLLGWKSGPPVKVVIDRDKSRAFQITVYSKQVEWRKPCNIGTSSTASFLLYDDGGNGATFDWINRPLTLSDESPITIINGQRIREGEVGSSSSNQVLPSSTNAVIDVRNGDSPNAFCFETDNQQMMVLG